MATEYNDVELEGIITGSSGKAILFQADDWDKAEWLPRSQIEISMQPEEEDRDEKKAVIYIRRWLAEKNGWA